jgi:hypothetical protein
MGLTKGEQMKKKLKKLQISKETVRLLEQESLRQPAGGLQDSENGQGCTWTAGGSCGEWTCFYWQGCDPTDRYC